ncbi:hypothetical protein BDR26DRAFT_954362 [Obelidium mucronatum]|nr:hypothetical protein BDR26DRAFT_954362 [Obelidium mucronatum]
MFSDITTLSISGLSKTNRYDAARKATTPTPSSSSLFRSLTSQAVSPQDALDESFSYLEDGELAKLFEETYDQEDEDDEEDEEEPLERPRTRSAVWDDSQLRQLKEAVLRVGSKDFGALSNLLPGRTSEQVRSRLTRAKQGQEQLADWVKGFGADWTERFGLG